MNLPSINRRNFLLAAGAVAAGAAGCVKVPHVSIEDGDPPLAKPEVPAMPAPATPLPDYKGPNVVLIRFGGGVRRLETVMEPEHTTYCPFVYHELGKKHGLIYPKVEIHNAPGIETSHGQGTLFLLTGQYDSYKDVGDKFLGARFEAKVPTLFEYLRRSYNVPEHQALIVNGEDRLDEEFYEFSSASHLGFGLHYKSVTLSLYRFKTWLLWDELKHGKLSDKARQDTLKKFLEMEHKDYRVAKRAPESIEKDSYWASKEIDGYWERWKNFYGKTGLVNPRGDRLLTELAIRAIRELRPKLMMINYNDPDYVHWGPPSFYTNAISIIDHGIRQLWDVCQMDEEYRDNTVFVIVPDCGRDNSRGAAVPFQHHFNGRSAREIFAVVAGPKKYVPRAAKIVDKIQTQIRVTTTVGKLMGFKVSHAQAAALEGYA